MVNLYSDIYDLLIALFGNPPPAFAQSLCSIFSCFSIFFVILVPFIIVLNIIKIITR